MSSIKKEIKVSLHQRPWLVQALKLYILYIVKWEQIKCLISKQAIKPGLGSAPDLTGAG